MVIDRLEQIWSMSESDYLSVTIDKKKQVHPSKTLIVCHGLTGDKIGPQKLLSHLSSYIASSNDKIQILRFDFRGSGLSSGDFIHTTLTSMCQDALWIAGQLTTEIIWSGISTGAVVALMAAAKRNKKESLIAISNGFLETENFKNLDQEIVSIRNGQLYLSRKYFLERSCLHPRKNLFKQVGSITTILGSSDQKHFSQRALLMAADVRVDVIEGGDHLFTNPQTRKQLFLQFKDRLDEQT